MLDGANWYICWITIRFSQFTIQSTLDSSDSKANGSKCERSVVQAICTAAIFDVDSHHLF